MQHVVAVKSTLFRKDQPSRLISEQMLEYLQSQLLADPNLAGSHGGET
jgi:hypothetical protein